MGDKSIRTNEKKKKKSTDVKSVATSALKEPLAEPELVQKKKKKGEEA